MREHLYKYYQLSTAKAGKHFWLQLNDKEYKAKFVYLQNGDTALHISAALKRRKISKLLVDAFCDVNIKNKVNIINHNL